MLSFINGIVKSFSLIKIGFLLLNFSYIIFLLVVLTQVISLERIIKEIHDAMILRIIILINIALSIFFFILGFVIL